MQTRRCGKSELALPVLGIGCFSYGGGAYWGDQSQHDVDAVVGRALDMGVNLFDTAESYNDGASEYSLGLALAGRRDRAVICTKVRPDHAYATTLRKCCEASLRRLATDRLDVYMLHWPLNANAMRHYTNDERDLARPPLIAEALSTMAALRQEGKILNIGVSNFGHAQMQEALSVGAPIVLNEGPYNLLMRGIEEQLIPDCSLAGVGILGYMSIFQGLLSDKFEKLEDVPPMRTRTRHFGGDRPGSRHGELGIEAETMAAIEGARNIAREIGVPLSDLALWWSTQNPAITSTLVGVRNVAQLEENVRPVNLSIDPAVRRRLDAVTETVKAKLGPGLDYFQGSKDTRSW